MPAVTKRSAIKVATFASVLFAVILVNHHFNPNPPSALAPSRRLRSSIVPWHAVVQTLAPQPAMATEYAAAQPTTSTDFVAHEIRAPGGLSVADEDGAKDDDDGAKGCAEAMKGNSSSCEAVRAACPQGTAGMNLVNYFTFQYCSMGSAGARVFGWTFIVAWLLLVFCLLATTADNYFVPQLETMSEFLKLPPDIAGITLLALGNSSPDVFSDLAAVQSAGDFKVALGELLGASMFLTTCVLGAVVIVATKNGRCTVEKSSFLRDIGVFCLAIALILVTASSGGEITMNESLLFLALYVVYVVLVIASTRVPFLKRCFGTADVGGEDGMGASASDQLLRTELTAPTDGLGKGIDAADEDPSACVGLDWDPDASFLDKFIFVAEYPFSWLRWLSIANFDGEWSAKRRYLSTIAPMGAVLICFTDNQQNAAYTMTVGTSGFPYWLMLVGFAAPFSLLIFFCSNNDQLPRWHMLLVLLGFGATVAWLDLIANECVALLEAVGLMLGISTDILAVTVLAWANSIGDMVADTAVCRAGKPQMGVASVFGSPLLTACLGIGSALTIAITNNGTPMKCTGVNSPFTGQVKLGFVFIGISLASSLVVIPYCGYAIPRFYAYYLFLLYLTYMLILTLLAAGIISDSGFFAQGM